jgi:ketosteroid isomerase-like protein
MKKASLQDESDVRRLLAIYCHLCDDSDYDGVVSLFTPDAELIYGEFRARGSAALKDFFIQFQNLPHQKGKHLAMNTVVDVDGDRGVAVSDVLFVKFMDGALLPHVAARYRDEIQRVNGEWRFGRREILKLSPPGA